MAEDGRRKQTQAEIWNGVSGRTWAELSAMLDEVFGPLETPLLDAAAAGGARVLDVGCGAGGTTLRVARRLGPEGRCTGIDISAPLIEAATRRAATEDVAVNFIHGDAQTYAFEAGHFDTVLSRLGVMFFDDPEAAFANLRRAARSGGRLAFVAWRSRDENPFMTAAERAAASVVSELLMGSDGSPGQFGLASADRIRGILQASDWTSIEIRPLDAACDLSLAQLPIYVTRMGLYGRIRHTLAKNVRAKADEAVLAAFEPYQKDDRVCFTSACWLVTALG